MAIIYSYTLTAPKPKDIILGTVTLDENSTIPVYGNPTVNFSVQSVIDLVATGIGAQSLQQVTNVGATTSNVTTFESDIKVDGRFFDSAGQVGTTGQLLSSTVVGTSWTNAAAAGVSKIIAGTNVTITPTGGTGNVTINSAGNAYVLPLAANGTRGGVQIGYTLNGKNYPLQLTSEKAFVNVPWTDTPYTLPLAANGTLGGVQIGYTTDAAARNYAVTLAAEKMLVNVPWTDTPPNANQTITGSGSGNTDSGITLSASGGTVKILGDGTVVTAAQSGNVITLTGINTWIANAVTVAGYVAAPAASDANLVWKTDASGNPAWRTDATIPDTGITGVTLAVNSTGSWTVPLSESISGRELTLTSNVYGGTTKVGFVPTGGSATTFLRGDGSWGAIPTGLTFKGTWSAAGAAGGNPDLTALTPADGWLYIVSTAGDAEPNGASGVQLSPWSVGDWCVYNGTAWTRVPSSTAGVTTFSSNFTSSGASDPQYISGSTLNASTGGVDIGRVNLNASDGTSDGTTKFLSKDNTWDVPSYTTNTDETYDLNVGAKSGTSVPVNLTSTSGTDDSAVSLTEGNNITLTRDSATEITIAATNTQNTYTAGAGLSLSSFEFSADIDTTAANDDTVGLVAEADRFYAVQLDNNSTAADRKMVVNVPWVSGAAGNYYVTGASYAAGTLTLTRNGGLASLTATGFLQVGTAATDALAGNTTTITAAQATAITANTAKVGITTAQATAITDNTAKVGITTAQATAITANTAKVGITTAQANEITANTAKVGITVAQAADIVTNTAKVGITTTQATAITNNTAKVTDSGIPAILSDGTLNRTAVLIRSDIGAGTGDGDGDVTLTGTQTLTNKTLTSPVLSGITTTADLSVTNEITVNKTNATTPGKITIKGNSGPIFQLKSEDTAMADNELIGAIEFFNSDGTANPGVKAKIESRALYLGGSGNEGSLGFYTALGSYVNPVRRLLITPAGGFSFGATSSTVGTSGQILTSAGNAPPTWQDAAAGGVSKIVAGTNVTISPVGGTGDVTVNSTDQYTGDVTLTGVQTLTNKTLTIPKIDVIEPSTAVLTIKGTGSSGGDAKIILNCYVNSHGQTLAAQPHSAGTTNTMLLPKGSSSTLASIAMFGNGLTASETAITMSGSYTGTFTATGDLVAYSDEKLKSNVKTLDGSKVYDMHGVSFDKDGKKGSGVIAQELEKIAPELIHDEGEYKAVAYGNISGYLIEAIKDLKAEIEELKNKPCNCNCK